MRLKGIWILCALVLGAVAFAAAGCGGDSETTTVTVTVEATDTTDDSFTETETTDDTLTETGATETETTDETLTETDAMTTNTTDDSGSAFATSENCREFVRFADALGDAISGTGDEDVQEAADAMQRFADEAPEEIRADFLVLAAAYSKIADALEGIDINDPTASPEAIAKLTELAQELNTTELTQASANITAWTTENCTGG